MESYGNDMSFLSQEGYPSIDFTLLDRPSTSVASAPEFTAPLLPDSSFPSLDFLDGSGIDSLGGVLRNAEEAHFHSHGRPELQKDIDWRKEKALHASSANMYIQGGENPEPKLSSSQLHIPVSQGNFFSAKQSGSDNLQAQLSTSGNRVGDEVHDFFEQEHLSQQQSQLDKANWSVMNNNAWPDDSQNNESRHIHQSSYNTEPNPQPDDGLHSSRMALGVRSPQEGPNNNVMKSQSRNQPVIFDSLLNGPSTGHIRSNHATSAGDGGTPERNQSSTGSLAGPDIQQGHIVGQGSNHSRNSSEGVENVEARVNYDFLGSQLLLKGQPQAGPQFHGTRLQPGLEEQLWKHYSYQKQLQELHRQQQIPQLEQHARQHQAQQLEQQARQPQAQQLGQQARQAQAQLLEHQRRQQVQLMQQARRQHAQQLEHQARQQQAQQLQQQARQQQAQQLEHARQQQAQLLEQHARQQLEQHARQQQAQQLEQHSRQQQLQQLLVGDKQNLGNQFSPSPYGSSMHNVSNFMHSGGLMSQMAIESHNPSLLPGNLHQFNVGNMNGMLNCPPSLPGLPNEALLAQDPYLAWQAMTMMGAQLDPSVYGSSTSTMRDAAGQPLNLYPSSQGAVQELADAANKIPSAANHQVGKPVVRTPVLGASVLGNHRTSSFDPISAENDGKQKALNKSLFGQSFPQNFPQPSETPQGISNFPQGTTIPRNSQVQDFHLNQQHRSWTEDIGQKENFQEGPSQVLVNSDAPSESGFYNSQPSGWHSVHSPQVVASSDSRIQNTNAGQYVHQGSYQMGNADIFGSLASKPQGSWSALMQSAVAESPSGDADQDDWSSLSLQKTEPASGDYLQLQPNPKQQSIWSEQNVSVSSSMNGRSFHLLNNVNSQLGVQSVQGLQQSGSEVGSHLESKLENIQHNNQIKLQPGSSSQFLQETPRQASGLQEQTLYQPSDNSRSIHSHTNFDDQHQNSWKSQDIEQVPSDVRVSSHYVNFDGRQQFNSLGDQGNSKTESDRIFHLTSKEQSCWSKSEAQGTEQNNLLVNANKGHDKNENDNITHLEREQLGSHVQKGEDQTYHTRNEVSKDTATPFQHQDPNVNSCQNGQIIQQEGFHMGRFPRNPNTDNLESNAERYEQTPESNYQLNSNNVILDSYAKNRRVGNTSVYQQGNSSLALNPFPNVCDSSQRYTNDISRSQYSQNDCTSVGQIAGKGDLNQSAKAGSDYTGKSPQREDDLQSLSNMNHWGYSRLSKMSTGSGESSGNDMLRMPPRHLLQQAAGMVSMNQWHAESVKQDSSLRGIAHLDSQVQNTPEQPDFGQSKVVRTASLNSTMNAGKDVLNTNLQTNLREQLGGGHLKDFSIGYASANSSVFDSPTNISGSNKPASLSSQNVLDLLSRPDNPNESDPLKHTICSEQNASVDPCESSSPDVSLTHFGHNQSSSPLSPRGFGLRLAPPARMQSRSLQTSASMQTANVINDRQTHPSKGESAQKSAALATHQDSLSKVSDAATAEGKSLHVTSSPKPLSVPCESSPTSLKDNAVKLDKSPYIAASDIHPSTQLQYIQHPNATGQFISIPQSVVPRAVTQRQANMQGNTISTHQLQGSQDVAVAGQVTPTCHSATPSTVSSVNAVIERETEMPGSLTPSTQPFSQINYQNALLVQDGLGRSHQFLPVNSNLSGPRNPDQGLQESQSNSAHHLPGPSGRPQTAEFSKLLNALKTTLANRQRMSMGAEKVLPNSFDSFRPSMGGPGNNLQSYLPSMDSQPKFGMVGKPMASVHGQIIRPSIINSQQPPSAGELSKQESSFQQMASDRAESSASPGPQTSAMVLPIAAATLPHQTFAASPQLSMLQSQGQDQRRFLLSKIHSGTATSVASPFHSSICAHNQEQSNPTSGQDYQSQVNLRAACPPTQQQSDSCSDDPVESQASEPSDAPHHQYISSSRMSPMTTMQTDFDRQAVKRLKISDAGSGGIDPNLKAKSIDQTMNPHYGIGQFKIATTHRTAQQQVSLPVDARMLPSSQGIKERREEASNQGMVSIMQNRLQNQGYNHNIYGSSQSSSGAGDRNHFNPQILNSRLLQFGPNTNERLLALQVASMYKRLGESGRSGTLNPQQIPPGRNVEHLFPGSGLAPTITSHTSQSDLKEVESAVPVRSPTAMSLPVMEGHTANQHQYYLSKGNIGAPVAVLPTKRKKEVSRLIPWHVDITQAGGHLPTTSDAELAWASSTNRLTEKEEDEIDNQEEGAGSVPRVKRRLKLTTQLMQQLIPPIPAAVVRGKASVEYEDATYTLAKTALRDACKLASTSRKDMGKKAENENLAFGQLQKPKRLKGNSVLRIAESFMDRAKNLEDEFSRLEASSLTTDLRSDTQDLESLSIMNRLVKHHGRNLPVDHSKVIIEERESSSDSAFCTRKLCPQRYVTAVPMPRNLPEGVLCFSL